MAINKNHEFEELDGIKCGIVEKNATQERVDFLKPLLEFNGYTVMVAPSPPPKAASLKEGEEPLPLPALSFTIGVTDYTFNPINAIFGRNLRTKDGHIVTLAYWKQQVTESNDEIPYFEK